VAAPATQPLPDLTLPDLTLPCLRPGADVRLAEITGPALVNVWASWCAPCRTELPALQRYAERAAGRVRVIGVDSGDVRDHGRSLVDDLGVRFPMLFDDREALRGALAAAGLPVTVFVTAERRIAYVYNLRALDDATVEQLAERYLGVALPP
jgi:thiol-disulfide isomerase/thioredoxin